MTAPWWWWTFPEARPARLTRFLKMSLDNCHATDGFFVSIRAHGHVMVRIEGASACGVWFRVDQWPTALGRHPRLRCESFHGVADAMQLSSPSTVRQLDVRFSSVRSNRVLPVPPLDDLCVPDSRVLGGGPRNLPETTSLRALVHQLIELCRGNQMEIARLQDVVFANAHPCTSGPATCSRSTCCGNNPRLCRHVGCFPAVSASCPVRFCQTHCTSPRRSFP